MPFNEAFLFSLLLVFTRVSAMLLISPVFGVGTPIQVRIGLCACIAFALTPVIGPHLGAAPADLFGLLSAVGQEALTGLLIGSMLQMIGLAAQMAGSFLDLQIGLSTVQLLNPLSQTPSSLFAQFKYLLAVVLLVSINGHHMMIQAFVESYTISGPGTGLSPEAIQAGYVGLLGKFSLLALQIAAPAAAVSIIIDAAASVVNKAVPQMQVFLVAMPLKVVAGVLAIAVALPAMVTAVDAGVEHAFTALGKMLEPGGAESGVRQ